MGRSLPPASERLAWGKFNWKDWLTDPALRMCSVAARGLWIDMLCIAATNDPIGYITISGTRAAIEDLAFLLRMDPTECATLLSELKRRNVFSVDTKGRIFSRRMVRDAAVSQKMSENVRSRIRTSDGKLKRTESSLELEEKRVREESPLAPKGAGPALVVDNTKPAKPDRGKRVPLPEQKVLFERFWTAYPRKVAQPVALQAFLRAWDRLPSDPAERERVLLHQGVKGYLRQIAKFQTPTDKIAHPTTWLNQDRWNDDYPPAMATPTGFKAKV